MDYGERLTQEAVTLPGGSTIAYFVGGAEDGAPVVLLHGGGTDHALLSWRETIPALLDAGYRVYAPNYPGYGDSPLDESQPSSMKALIGYLEVLMDHWLLHKAALVGVSMGAALAIGYTLRHQERVRRLVLIGAYGIQDKAPFHRVSYFFVRMPWLLNLTWALARGSRWAARYSLNSIVRNPESRTESLVDEVLAAMQNLDSQKVFGQWQRDEVRWNGIKTNYTSQLESILVPVLMIHGTHDLGVPLEAAQRAASRFPDVRLEVIDDAGHWTQRDYPERVNVLLVDFLPED